VLIPDDKQRLLFGKEKDIFAIGVLMYYIASSGKYIFTGNALNRFMDSNDENDDQNWNKVILAHLRRQEKIVELPSWINLTCMIPIKFKLMQTRKDILIESLKLSLHNQTQTVIINSLCDLIFDAINPDLQKRPDIIYLYQGINKMLNLARTELA
jgi:hypothetical protein